MNITEIPNSSFSLFKKGENKMKKIDYKYINPNKIKSVNKPISYKNGERQPRDIDEFIYGYNMDKHSYK